MKCKHAHVLKFLFVSINLILHLFVLCICDFGFQSLFLCFLYLMFILVCADSLLEHVFVCVFFMYGKHK